jgi:hypothetical protein
MFKRDSPKWVVEKDTKRIFKDAKKLAKTCFPYKNPNGYHVPLLDEGHAGTFADYFGGDETDYTRWIREVNAEDDGYKRKRTHYLRKLKLAEKIAYAKIKEKISNNPGRYFLTDDVSREEMERLENYVKSSAFRRYRRRAGARNTLLKGAAYTGLVAASISSSVTGLVLGIDVLTFGLAPTLNAVIIYSSLFSQMKSEERETRGASRTSQVTPRLLR